MDFSKTYLSIETKAEFIEQTAGAYHWRRKDNQDRRDRIDRQIARLQEEIKELRNEKKSIKTPSFKKYCETHTWEMRVRDCRDLAKREGFIGLRENEDSLKVPTEVMSE